MEEKRIYTIGKNRWKRALLTGVKAEETLVCLRGYQRRSIFFEALDSGEKGAEWGRLCIQGEFSDNMIFSIHLLALDNREIGDVLLDKKIEISYKKKLLEQEGELCFRNQKDMLLYSLKGRYLWIFIEIWKEGKGVIRKIQVEAPGNHFLSTFPEIYQERGSFFHRYLSVFSSIYYDLQEKIDTIPSLLSADTAPKWMLGILASWLGLDLGGTVLEEQKMRSLVKEAYQLCKYKGTRYAISRITEIIIGEVPIIIEQKEERDGVNDSDITILLKTQNWEEEKYYLWFLFQQFKPAESHIKLVVLRQEGKLDSYCYLDCNAAVYEGEAGRLDRKMELDRMIFLQSKFGREEDDN